MPCARRKRPITLRCGWHPIPAHACLHPSSNLYQSARLCVPWPATGSCGDLRVTTACFPGPLASPFSQYCNFATCRTDRETMLIALLWSVSTKVPDGLQRLEHRSSPHTHTPCCRCSADGGELAVSARRQRYIASVQPTRESSFVFRRLFLPARPHPLLFVCVCC
jgi:hypothetical protein